MTAIRVLFCLIVVILLNPPAGLAKTVNDYLSAGALGAGILDFTARVERQPGDADRFALATLNFVQSIETLAQSFHRYGLDSRIANRVRIPFLRLPVPENPQPEAIGGRDLRNILQQFEAGMIKCNRILQKIEGHPFIVPIEIGRIQMDLNGDGRYEARESFKTIYTIYNRRSRQHFQNNNPLEIRFDAADAQWLKGYTHLLMALTNSLLAYDGSRLFEYVGHVFFPNAKTEMGRFLKLQQTSRFSYYADLIAGLHAMPLAVREPKRLTAAHTHLLGMIEASRASWRLIEAEVDDDKEWLPNSNQTSVTGVRFSPEMIAGWKAVLNEIEAILLGRKLIPHWRVTDGRGINLKDVFLKPRPFDLVLWAQGSAIIPYLEKGECSSKETWRRLRRVFRGDFMGFALWIN